MALWMLRLPRVPRKQSGIRCAGIRAGGTRIPLAGCQAAGVSVSVVRRTKGSDMSERMSESQDEQGEQKARSFIRHEKMGEKMKAIISSRFDSSLSVS